MLPLILLSTSSSKTKEYLQELERKGFFLFELKPKNNRYLLIEEIKELKKFLLISSSKKRCIVIHKFDTASYIVQNSMLKVLEENNENNLFILLCKDIRSLLPTVISRSKIIDIRDKRHKETFTKNNFIFSSFSEFPHIKTKEDAISFFNELVIFLRNKLQKGDYRSSNILRTIFETLFLIENYNLDPQLSTDYILLSLKKLYT